MEELAESAADVHNIGKDAHKLAPLADAQIDDQWCSKFMEDAKNTMMEAQTILANQSPEHSPREVHTMATLMDGPAARAPVQPIAAVLPLQTLEDDAFTHLLNQLDYDVTAMRVYKDKINT